MRIDVAFTPGEPPDAAVAIVIDVLRATTTITHALGQGYERVLACAGLDRARELRTRLGDGTMLAGDIGPGDWVALHWDWVCDKLTDRQLRALRTYTMRHLDMVNHRVDHPGPVAILG